MYNVRDFRFECSKSIMHEHDKQMGNINHIINNKNCLLLYKVMLLRVLS